MLEDRIYLDHNATSPLRPQVRAAMVDAMQTIHGNASSIHREGQASRAAIERARRAIATAIGANAAGLVFTSGATEANNQVIRSFNRVAVSAVEHPSALHPAERASQFVVLGVDGFGRIDLEEVERAASDADLVCVMMANNELGNVYDVAAIGEVARGQGAAFHVDATQALGRIPVNFEAVGADFMTLSFHKAGGPRGFGALVIREGVQAPTLLAGGAQERGRRPGTENVVAARGAAALADLYANPPTAILEAKRRLLLERLQPLAPRLHGDQESRLPNTLNLGFPGVVAEELIIAMDLRGVAASAGSACHAGALDASHVLRAIGLTDDEALENLRLSIADTTTDEELQASADVIADCVDQVRR